MGSVIDRQSHVASRIVTEHHVWIGGCESLSIVKRYAASFMVNNFNDMSPCFATMSLTDFGIGFNDNQASLHKVTCSYLCILLRSQSVNSLYIRPVVHT